MGCSHCKTQQGNLTLILPSALPKSRTPDLSSAYHPDPTNVPFSAVFFGKLPPTLYEVSHLYYLGISTFTPPAESRLGSEKRPGSHARKLQLPSTWKGGDSSECCAVSTLSSHKFNHTAHGKGANLNSVEKRLPVSPNESQPSPGEPQVGEGRSQHAVGVLCGSIIARSLSRHQRPDWDSAIWRPFIPAIILFKEETTPPDAQLEER